MWMNLFKLRSLPPIVLAALIVFARPVLAATPDRAAAVSFAVPEASSLLQTPASTEKPADGAIALLAPGVSDSRRYKSEFNVNDPDVLAGRTPSSFTQRGEYSVLGMNLMAEMGDLRIDGTANTVPELSRRGGRFALTAASAGNAMRLQSFAAPVAAGSASGGIVVGAGGELSLLSEGARFKTIFLSGREPLDRGAKPSRLGERRGDVLGMVAVLEPYKGRLAAEAELDFSLFDEDTADQVDPVRDSALRVQLGGELASYRYLVLYERTGPQYRLIGGKGPRRDWEGVATGLGTSLGLHTFDLRLSRYHDNTDNNELYPRLYRYEGLLEYSVSPLEALPLGLRYRKTFVDSAREPAGYLAKRTEEDAVSGRANYLAGKWDLGLTASYSLKTDRLTDQRQESAATVAFLPKYAGAAVSVAPDFTLKRSLDYPSSLRTDQYAVSLGISGLLARKIDCQLKGGYKWEVTGASYRKETVGANVKAAYPLATLFQGNWKPTLGVTGEYKGTSESSAPAKENAFTLLFSLEGRSLL